jgi:16S rRNA pseudouridine516 synthase
MSETILNQIEAVLFDLDGTLVDSLWVWKEIDIEYLGRFGIVPPLGLQEDIGGMSFTETAAYIKERFEIPDSVEQMKEDWNRMAWDKYTHEVPLKKGVPEFLALCREKGIRLGIATSNSRLLVENILRAHGLEGVFDCIVTGCEVNKGKPSPDVYLEAAKRCGVMPKNCLVFEDIVPGILAGKAAGMKVCAVHDAFSEEQSDEKRRLADSYIMDYTELSQEV